MPLLEKPYYKMDNLLSNSLKLTNASYRKISKRCGFDLIVLIVINNATKGDFFAAMQDKKF